MQTLLTPSLTERKIDLQSYSKSHVITERSGEYKTLRIESLAY